MADAGRWQLKHSVSQTLISTDRCGGKGGLNLAAQCQGLLPGQVAMQQPFHKHCSQDLGQHLCNTAQLHVECSLLPWQYISVDESAHMIQQV